MTKIFLARFFGFQSDNLKSKTCGEFFDSAEDKLCRTIKNPKWIWIVALAVTVALCGAVAQAQQTGKVARIGFLDPSTAAASAVRLQAFWQEVRKLGWIEGKNLTIEYRFAEGKMTVYLSLPRTWFVLRSI